MFYTLGNLKRRFHSIKIIKNVKSIGNLSIADRLTYPC
jgi:hypothetical protein